MIHPALQNILTVFQVCLTGFSKSVWIGNTQTIEEGFPFFAVKSSSLPMLLHSEIGRAKPTLRFWGRFWDFPVLCPLLPCCLWNSQATVFPLYHTPPACWRKSLSQWDFTRGNREALCIGIADIKEPWESEEFSWGRGEEKGRQAQGSHFSL